MKADTLTQSVWRTQMLTQQQVKDLFIYDYETGVFTNIKNRANNKVKANSVATVVGSDGYLYLSVNYKKYSAHRVAWLYMYGELLKYIDHINGIVDDNRICNLREATNQQNAFNSKIQSNNTSGYKGVSWDNLLNNWRARASLNGKTIHLGSYENILDAARAYNEFSIANHGEFYRPNLIA